MQRQTEKARYEADEKHKLYTSLTHEVEELRGIRAFNATIFKKNTIIFNQQKKFF